MNAYTIFAVQVEAAAASATHDAEMDTVDEDKDTAQTEAARPNFPALSARQMGGGQDDYRRIRCPPHRLTPLRNSWENIVTPTVEHMKLQIRCVLALRKIRVGVFDSNRFR